MKKKSENPIIRQNQIALPIPDESRAFLAAGRAKQLSTKTTDFYSYHLDILLRYCEEAGLRCMGDLEPADVRDLLDRYGKDHNRGGVHALYRTVRAFCNWFEKEIDDDCPWRNPMRKVDAPKNKLDPIPGVSPADVQAMVEGAGGRGWYSRRDSALLLFLFDTGLRVSECLALDWLHIDFTARTVQVIKGKGDKNRVVFFGDETAAALRRYQRGHARGESPVWVNRFGERIDPDCLRDILRARALSAGLTEIPSAHDFRRGFALNMLRNGADLISVSRLLGHESLEVTKRYLALVQDDLQHAHEYASPVHNMSTKGKKRQ